MGHLEPLHGDVAAFQIVERNGTSARAGDGAVGCGGAVVGTMIHGLFENDALRAGMVRLLRARRGLAAPERAGSIPTKASEYDRLARAVRESIDLPRLSRIIGL
jgi:adenosylcobyric acid synthase